MKTKITSRMLWCSLLLLVASNLIAQTNVWVSRANFGGSARDGAVSFTINGKGYICTGGTSANGQAESDVWEYDPIADTWTQKGDFPGHRRLFAAGFVIGNYGYLGTGFETSYGSMADFWRYDPSTDIWNQIATFPGGATYLASSFSVNGKGYVCLGQWSTTPDVWEYDPATDTWSQKNNFPGGARTGACAFSIGNKGYIATGDGLSLMNDLWQYNPANDSWVQKANFGGVIRTKTIGFSLGSFGYIGTGVGASSTYYSDMWKYDTLLDQWSQIANFPGVRSSAIAFVIGNRAYAGTGRGYFQDIWEYIPDSVITTGIQNNSVLLELSTFPNPATDHISINTSGSCLVTIHNMLGQIVGEYQSSGILVIERNSVPPGVYFLTATEGEKSETVRIVFIE